MFLQQLLLFFFEASFETGKNPPKNSPFFSGFFFHISPKIPSSVSVMIWCRTIKLDIFGVWADMRREAHARRVDPQFGQRGKPVGERNGGFQKWWYPQIIHFNRDFHYKPSILGYPYFWKHPNGSRSLSPKETLMTHTHTMICVDNKYVYYVPIFGNTYSGRLCEQFGDQTTP